jgi:putative flippase GtrA
VVTGGRAHRFALVGVVNTLIDFLLFTVLIAAGLGVLAANTVSTSAGMAFSFVVNRAWSFRSERPARQTVVPFLAVTLVGLWVLHPIVILGTAAVGRQVGHEGDAVLWLGKVAAVAVGLVWNFTWYDRVVFKEQGAPS